MRKHFLFSVSVALSIVLLANPLLIGFAKRSTVAAAKKLEPVASPKKDRMLRPTRPVAEEGQSATLLPNGHWLLLGGQGADGPRNTAAVKDPFTGQTQELPAKLHTPRAWHSATMLPDGRILVFGGVGVNGKVINHSEIFNSRSLKFETAPPTRLPTPRAHHSATLLLNGTVLIAGGEVNGELVANAELWSPKTGPQPVNGLNVARRKHQATLLSDGNVLVQGGVDAAGNDLVAAAEIFNAEIRGFAWAGNFTEQADARPAFLTKSQPRDGAGDVPVDTSIALLFSKPLRVDTVTSETCALVGPTSEIVSDVVPAESGRLAFITPRERLETTTSYNVFVSSAVDSTGNLIASTVFSFTTAGDGEDENKPDEDLPDSTSDPEKWKPGPHNFRGTWRSDYPESHWQKLPPLSAAPGVTAVAGQVLTLDGKALANVTLTIAGKSTRTDQTGRFLLQGVDAGHQVLVIDGRSANSPARTYGIFRAGVDITGGKTDVLGFTIWMPRLDVEHAVDIQAPTSGEVTITNPDIPGLELQLPANTLIRDLDGKTVTNITITPIPVDRPPFPLPPGINVPIFFTIQPGGAQIIPPRARVIYPNYTNALPNSRIDFWNYDPVEKGWYVYGQGTVTPDRKQVIPDPGVVIYEFSGVMINYGESPPADAPVPCNPTEIGDPVDPSTGLFIYRKTDLYLPDVLPISLERTYRNQDFGSRPFGIGSTHPYHMFLWSARQYREADLILPDGSRVHFDRTTPGESPRFAEFRSTANCGPFYMAELYWSAPFVPIWHLRLRDGTILAFGENAPLQAIIDKYGNTTTISRASVNQFGSPIGNVTRVTSPNGKYIDFTYTGSRITKIKDNMSREVNYTYDASNRLWKVTDANNGVTEYTYDLAHRMTSIKDARGIVYLTNEYDSNGRVRKQTLADDTPATNADNPKYFFNYVTNSGGKIIQTDITDPRGSVRRVSFNAKGYWLTNTSALGTADEQTSSVERQPNTNLVMNTIDPLGRRTAFTYDELGDVSSITRMALTASASTTRYTYHSSAPATVTDPLGRTTYFGYDQFGALVSVVDPLGRQTTIQNNSQGQPVLIKDPLGNTVSLEYQSGDLVAIVEGGRRISRAIDDVGRALAITDAIGQTAFFDYDALNRLKKVTDAQGGITEFTYDPNGNLLSLKDPRQKITTYTYDNMDRLLTRTDALAGASSTEHYEYDPSGNLKKFTDRRGKVTSYTYDNLDRVVFAGFGEMPAGVFESQVTYSYDVGNRLRVVTDSTSGSISLDYDDFDSLISESTPRGIVSVTYDKVGRRETLTVPNQAQVNYKYDDADRLTEIIQGTSKVAFTYDDGDRLVTKLLPNNVVAEYQYDNDSAVTGIVYRLGDSILGDLNYEYDERGFLAKVGGSFARTNLPAELNSATYDDANRVTNRAGTTFTYDANGNLTNDGTNTYTWSARNQLIGISGSVNAEFQYDGFGRRVQKTVNGVSTGYLYDRADVAQEQYNAAPSINIMSGGLDTLFSRSDGTAMQTLLSDAQGSTIATTDQSGAVQGAYTYDPFGNTTLTGSTDNPSQFTARENDNTGLYYYRSRYYSPSLQRFISEDPAKFDGGDLNLYGYVGNNPVNLNDPYGLQGGGPENLGLGYSARIDTFSGGESFEIHVFNPKGEEVGICSGRLGWIGKHGHPGAIPPGMPPEVLQKLNGINLEELRARGMVPPKGTSNVKNGRYLFPGRTLLSALNAISLAFSFIDEYQAESELEMRARKNGLTPEQQFFRDSERMGHPEFYMTPFGPMPNPYRHGRPSPFVHEARNILKDNAPGNKNNPVSTRDSMGHGQ